MAELRERLLSLYTSRKTAASEQSSWISKRVSDDPLVAYRISHPPDGHLSQVRSEEILSSQTWLSELGILVEKILMIKLHTDDISGQMENFYCSLATLSEKYGELLPVAIDACVENEIDFLQYTGFINKEVIKPLIKEMAKSRKRTRFQ